MDYLITNLIDELLWQVEDINMYAVIGVGYFAIAFAQYAGKYVALRENDKALDAIANVFYAGAEYGITHSQLNPKMRDETSMAILHYSLRAALDLKRSVWLYH